MRNYPYSHLGRPPTRLLGALVPLEDTMLLKDHASYYAAKLLLLYSIAIVLFVISNIVWYRLIILILED